MVSIGLWNRSYIALSNRNSGGQDSQYHIRVVVMITGKRGEVNQESFKVSYCMGDINDLTEERILALFNDAISELDALLDAPISPSGEMDIVIAAEAGGVIIHEAVGHGLEGDLQASSAYANRIGKKVASDAVTIVDDPTLLGLRGSYSIDHEGHPAARAELIKNGILQNYLHQQGTADFLKLPHNGHARRESYSAEAIVRMGNTYMDNGPDSPADIIASVSDGLYVTSL
jgi:TldD protein